MVHYKKDFKWIIILSLLMGSRHQRCCPDDEVKRDADESAGGAWRAGAVRSVGNNYHERYLVACELA